MPNGAVRITPCPECGKPLKHRTEGDNVIWYCDEHGDKFVVKTKTPHAPVVPPKIPPHERLKMAKEMFLAGDRESSKKMLNTVGFKKKEIKKAFQAWETELPAIAKEVARPGGIVKTITRGIKGALGRKPSGKGTRGKKIWEVAERAAGEVAANPRAYPNPYRYVSSEVGKFLIGKGFNMEERWMNWLTERALVVRKTPSNDEFRALRDALTPIAPAKPAEKTVPPSTEPITVKAECPKCGNKEAVMINPINPDMGYRCPKCGLVFPPAKPPSTEPITVPETEAPTVEQAKKAFEAGNIDFAAKMLRRMGWKEPEIEKALYEDWKRPAPAPAPPERLVVEKPPAEAPKAMPAPAPERGAKAPPKAGEREKQPPEEAEEAPAKEDEWVIENEADIEWIIADLGDNKETGRLDIELTGGLGKGEIYFKDGKIITAKFRKKQGKEAVNSLIRAARRAAA